LQYSTDFDMANSEYYGTKSKNDCDARHIMLQSAFDELKTVPEMTRNLKASLQKTGKPLEPRERCERIWLIAS